MNSPLSAQLQALTSLLLEVNEKNDIASILRLYDGTFLGPLRPRALSGQGGGEVLSWFEAWDSVLQRHGEGSLGPLLRRREGSGFRLGLLWLNAFWLERAGSARVVAPPQRAGSLHALLRTTARHPFDYIAAIEQIGVSERALLALWFLGGYLVEPLAAVDPQVAANRRAAVEGFVAFHRDHPLELPATALFGVSSFSANTFAEDPRGFLEVLSDRVLAPAITGLRRGGRARQGEGAGVVLSAWNADSAVYRCMNPVIGHLAGGETRAYTTATALPAPWQAERITLDSLEGTAQAADRIARDRLDFLFFPEVGLTNTRYLAATRLARVSAAGYGHPVTSGSASLHYFVGGAQIERSSRGYRERLVLLPGLGVSSEVPPTARAPRQREVGGAETWWFSLATHAKLNTELLSVWNAILEHTEGGRLSLAPGLPPAELGAALASLAPHLTAGDAELLPAMPRQDAIDLMAESDVYLDAFPFGGYNTVVEALSLGVPVLTLEGAAAPGRFAAAAVRLVGLPEWLIAKSPAEYLEIALRLARNPSLRAELHAMLPRERVLAALCSTDLRAHFDAAVAWMRAEGPRPGAPVYIEAGERPKLLDL